jgi:phage head maturation protease
VLFWTTGAPVLRGYYERYYEELSLDPKHVRMQRLNDGAPLLDSHNGFELRSVMGVVEWHREADGKQGMATVRFAKAADDPNADVVFRKVQDGIIQNISVGYRSTRSRRSKAATTRCRPTAPIDWEPYEISFVPMGADAAAGVRGAAHAEHL